MSIVAAAEPNCTLIELADDAMARGDVRGAANLLEIAAQRARDASTLLRLATVRRSLGDLPGAIAAAAAAVELAPRNFLMTLLLGSLREASGAIHGAERAYRMACAHAPVDLSFQPGIAKQLEAARRRVQATEEWRQALLHWSAEDEFEFLSGDEKARLAGFRSNILDNLDAGPLAPPMFLIPGIRSKRFFDPGTFDGVKEMAEATDLVRAEFLALWEGAASQLRPTQHAGGSGKWSMIPLIRDGVPADDFLWRCPTTRELAKSLGSPSIAHISPSLYFSVLEPKSRIAPHKGITNARVIVHFPLIVPVDCALRVGGETRAWQVGEPIVFDDTMVHEAWNDSDQRRVVLIADMWRPELTQLERRGVTTLMNCPGMSAD